MTKKRAITYALFAFSAFFIYSHGLCWATSSITAMGGWSDLTISASNLTGGAGSSLSDTYQSDPAAVQLNITSTGNWKVQVKKFNSTLPGSLHLHIRKTSAPAGSYQEVTDSDQDFSGVNGTGDSTVTAQFQLTGVSIQVPPGSYSATIQYTVLDQ